MKLSPNLFKIERSAAVKMTKPFIKPIITPEEAIDIIERYLEGSLEKTASLRCLANYSNFHRLTINKISIQYSKGAGDFAQPIYLIEGIAAYEGWEGTDEFKGRVDAVIRD